MPESDNDNADLSKYTKKIINTGFEDCDTVTFGDMHGNTIKLIYCLMRCGAISMQESDYLDAFYLYYTGMTQQEAESYIEAQKEYECSDCYDNEYEDEEEENEHKDKIEDSIFNGMVERFKKIKDEYFHNDAFRNIKKYIDVETTTKDMAKYIKLLTKTNDSSYINSFRALEKIIKEKITVIKEGPKVRLLGDLMGDRGQNDYLTLLLLKQIQSGDDKLDIEILFSNHDVLALHFFVSGLDNDQGTDSLWFANIQNIDKDEQLSYQRESFSTMYKLILKCDINKNEVLDLARTYYMPKIKLFSYSIENDGLTYYMHAPNNFTIIKTIHNDLFGVSSYDASTDGIELIKECIDSVNQLFSKNIMELNYSHFLKKDESKKKTISIIYATEGNTKIENTNKSSPQAMITNNRPVDWEKKGRTEKPTFKNISKFVVRACFGHISTSNTDNFDDKRFISLDSLFGMSHENIVGYLPELWTNEKPKLSPSDCLDVEIKPAFSAGK